MRSDVLLQTAGAAATVRVAVYDNVTGDLSKTWSCQVAFQIRPLILDYCNIPIATWNTDVSNGQVTLHTLDSSWNSSSGWFDGTNGRDLIIGNAFDNKINGKDESDCILGRGGQD